MSEFNWDALEEIVPRRDAKPPAPAFTVYEYMDKRAVSRNSARNTLSRAVEEGRLESGTYWNDERSKWLAYYWLPEKKK